MRTVSKRMRQIAMAGSVPLLLVLDLSPQAPANLVLVRDALAVVGAPATPVSVAGVARRTTRRVVATEAAAVSSTAAATSAQQQAVAQQQAATAQQQQAVAQQQAATAQQQAANAATPAIGTVVPALPAGCKAAPKNGIEYYQCGNVYYRAAFQGDALVYVVQQP